MINNRLLNEFKSDGNSTVIINNISCKTDCGQEIVAISTHKILTPFGEIIKKYDTINKTLEIEGQLELNDDKEYYTNLVGFISNESTEETNETQLDQNEILNDTYRSPFSHYIEEIQTELKREITIEFNRNYRKQPHVFITIDKQYENLYGSYSTTFIKNNLGTEYTGVKITFNNLKSKNAYPEIGICIIGDIVESYYDGIAKTETTANIHLFQQKANVIINIFEMIDMIKGNVKNTQIIIIDEDGNSVTYTSDNCGVIKPILKYGRYYIKVNDSNYKQDPVEFEVTPNGDNEFEIEAFLEETVTNGE